MKRLIFALFVASVAAFAKPVVSTTILPTKYFVNQVAGDEIEVNTMVGIGADPHTYEPKPAQMKALEKSDLYFSVGIEFDEIWLKKIAPKNLKIIMSEKDISKMVMMDHDHEHCQHHGDREHALDPHIWLDPVLVKIQAKNIKNALVEKYPEKKEKFEKNFAEFSAKLDELDSYAKDKLKDIKNRKFIVYHPSWGYFAKRYNLEQIAIEIEGKEPKPADLAELIKEAKEEGVKVIFVAPQFSKKSAQVIADSTGAKVVEIDQLPSQWYESMKKTIDIFADNL